MVRKLRFVLDFSRAQLGLKNIGLFYLLDIFKINTRRAKFVLLEAKKLGIHIEGKLVI